MGDLTQDIIDSMKNYGGDVPTNSGGKTSPTGTYTYQGRSTTALDELLGKAMEKWNAMQEQAMLSDSADKAFQQEMARQQLALNQQEMALKERSQAFNERDTITGRNLEAAGLATGPTGAIQLAYMARNQGAPQDQIRGIFQNLPFVQALLAGEALPGFGVPEQLGGPSDRVSKTGAGGIFGLTLPGLNAVSERQYSQMSRNEQEFLGALYQAEFGIPMEDALTSIEKSFTPTQNVQPLSIK
jgi:hypothetical protein